MIEPRVHFMMAMLKMNVEALRAVVAPDGELRYQLDELRGQINSPFCSERECLVLMDRVASVAERLATFRGKFPKVVVVEKE